jgi:hypothetical protein
VLAQLVSQLGWVALVLLLAEALQAQASLLQEWLQPEQPRAREPRALQPLEVAR